MFDQSRRGMILFVLFAVGVSKLVVAAIFDASVTQADALDISAHSDEVTVVADLSRADHITADQFDCFLNQFTMTVVYDVEAALYHSVSIGLA